MAKIYKSVNVNDTDGGGEVTPPYTHSFTVGSWGLDVDVYKISVPAATHGQGSAIIVQVFELVLGEYREVSTDIILSSIGGVEIEISSSPDLRFDGKLVIKGE